MRLITYRYYSHTEKTMCFYEQNKKPQSFKKPQNLRLVREKHIQKDKDFSSKSKKKPSYALYPTEQLTSNFKWNVRHYLQRYLRGTKRKDNETNHLLWKSFFLERYYPETYSWNCVLYLPFWETYFCKRTTFKIWMKKTHLPKNFPVRLKHFRTTPIEYFTHQFQIYGRFVFKF